MFFIEIFKDIQQLMIDEEEKLILCGEHILGL